MWFICMFYLCLSRFVVHASSLSTLQKRRDRVSRAQTPRLVGVYVVHHGTHDVRVGVDVCESAAAQLIVVVHHAQNVPDLKRVCITFCVHTGYPSTKLPRALLCMLRRVRHLPRSRNCVC